MQLTLSRLDGKTFMTSQVEKAGTESMSGRRWPSISGNGYESLRYEL